MVGRELKRAGQAPSLGRVLAEPGDLVEELLRVGADAAADVGLGHERQQVAAGRLADLDGQSRRVLAVGQEERDQVVADDGTDGFALGERDAEPPEDARGPGPPRARNAREPRCGRRASIAGAGRLGDVVKQGRGEQDAPVVVGQRRARRAGRPSPRQPGGRGSRRRPPRGGPGSAGSPSCPAATATGRATASRSTSPVAAGTAGTLTSPRDSRRGRQADGTIKDRSGQLVPDVHRAADTLDPAEPTAPEGRSCSRSGLSGEFGVPFAGEILDPAQWTQTALKKLPAEGRIELGRTVRPQGPGRPRPRLRQRPLPDRQRLRPPRPRPPRHRHAAGRHPLRPQARQPARADEPPVRGRRRARAARPLGRAAHGQRDPLLPPAAVLRPGPGPPPADHAGVPGPGSPQPGARRAVRDPDRQPGLLEVHPRGGADVLRLPRAHRPLAGRAAGPHAAGDHRACGRGLPVFRGHGTPRTDVTEENSVRLAEQLPPPTFDADRRLRQLDEEE